MRSPRSPLALSSTPPLTAVNANSDAATAFATIGTEINAGASTPRLILNGTQ
ncbi:hypothetical protein [Rhodoblastus sp.]|uniref:hypothetical protein n=1 Tax=Rhodoblastus sp. TaxID=1962975 RepID=UPI0035B3EAB1